MVALIPDERCFVLAALVIFLLMKMEQDIPRTSAATYKVMETHSIACLHFQKEVAVGVAKTF